MTPKLAGGRNIALKVPPHLYDAMVQFYRDVVGLKVLENHLPAVGFEFGANQLWIDCVGRMSQAEIWLELVADDVPAAARHLEAADVVRCDEIEPLPEGFEGVLDLEPGVDRPCGLEARAVLRRLPTAPVVVAVHLGG